MKSDFCVPPKDLLSSQHQVLWDDIDHLNKINLSNTLHKNPANVTQTTQTGLAIRNMPAMSYGLFIFFPEIWALDSYFYRLIVVSSLLVAYLSIQNNIFSFWNQDLVRLLFSNFRVTGYEDGTNINYTVRFLNSGEKFLHIYKTHKQITKQNVAEMRRRSTFPLLFSSVVSFLHSDKLYALISWAVLQTKFVRRFYRH